MVSKTCAPSSLTRKLLQRAVSVEVSTSIAGEHKRHVPNPPLDKNGTMLCVVAALPDPHGIPHGIATSGPCLWGVRRTNPNVQRCQAAGSDSRSEIISWA